MTEKRRETWTWIREYRARYGYSPTIQEIADHFGLASTNTVAERLDGLVRSGWGRRDPNLHQRDFIPVEANPETTTTTRSTRWKKQQSRPRRSAARRRNS